MAVASVLGVDLRRSAGIADELWMSPQLGHAGAVLYALVALIFSSLQTPVSSVSVLSRIQQTLRGAPRTDESTEQPWYLHDSDERAVHPCSINVDGSQGYARLANGFVELEVDLRNPGLRALRSDPSGNGNYGRSLLVAGCGFALERQDAETDRILSSCHKAGGSGSANRYEVHQSAEVAQLTLYDVVDNQLSPVAREQWHFALHRGMRSVDLRTNGTVLQTTRLTALRHSFALTAPSIYGLYDRGVAQMMRADASAGFYASHVPLRRVYMLGGDGAHAGSLDFAANDGIAVRLGSDGSSFGQTVLISDRQGVFSSTLHCGEHLVTGGPFLVSPNEKFYARVEPGALVVYQYAATSGDVDEIIWQTGPLWPSHNDRCSLVLQEDANLVLYSGTIEDLGQALWSTRTSYSSEAANSMLYLDDHGRLSLYPSDHIRSNKHKSVLWSSSEDNGWRLVSHIHRDDCLRHGEMLTSGGSALVSKNGLFAAVLEHTGDQLQIVVRVQDHRDRSVIVWVSNAPALEISDTTGLGSFVLQDDGNAVIYWQQDLGSRDLGDPIWHSGSHRETRSDYFLQMQDDGYLLLGAGDITGGEYTHIWKSGAKLGNRLRAGESIDASRMLLSNNLRFVAVLADDQGVRAGLAVLFFDGTDYLTVSAFGGLSPENPCDPDLPVALSMQEDGNLVLTRDEPVIVQSANGVMEKRTERVVVWTTDTHDQSGNVLVLEDDGTLVVGHVQESDERRTVHVAWTSAPAAARMRIGDSLEEGCCLLSPSREFSVVVEATGRLVVYRYSEKNQHRLGSTVSRSEYWCVLDEPTKSSVATGDGESDDLLKHSLVLQTDGNLIFVKQTLGARDVVFSTDTSIDHAIGSHRNASRELILTDQGDLQLIDVMAGATPQVVWTSADDSRLCVGTSMSVPSSISSQDTIRSTEQDWSTHPRATGLHRVIVGDIPTEDYWSGGWKTSQPTQTVAGMTWSSNLRLTPNGKNFPVSHVGSFHGRPEDFEAAMVGIWATAVGCLATADNAVVRGRRLAVTSPTLAAPSRGYRDSYSFFDPDTYFTLSAILLSGDTYLLGQVREILEFSANHQRREGQLPHHFDKDKPQFEALSGAQQSGPTIFWVLSSLEYVKYSGDVAWLLKVLPRLRHAVEYCMRTLQRKPGKSDFGHGLVRTNGSLLIDTFIRGNYSSDTNAMLAGFLLPELADAEELIGNTSGAHNLRLQARHLSDAINAKLWQDSHYLTQINYDGTVVDMVDYDANLIAVAGGVAAYVPGRPSQVLHRIDHGSNDCAAWGLQKGGPQWVSERWYGPDRTYLKNTGDSWCGMARIAYFDALSRIATGRSDLADAVLNRLSRDLLANTWLPERYGCSGDPQRNRTAYFFEYPSVISLMVAQMRYGIRLGLRTVSIRPSSEAPDTFQWHVGAGTTHELRVLYSQGSVAAIIPGALYMNGNQQHSANRAYKNWTIHGMSPKGLYTVDIHAIIGSEFAKSCDAAKDSAKWTRKKALAGNTGVLQFSALTARGCEVRIERRMHGLHVADEI